jgi:hypothetical protein
VVEQSPLRKRLLRLVIPATAATVLTGAVVGVAVGVPGHAPGGPDGRDVAADVHKPMKVDLGAEPSQSPYLAKRATTFSRSAKRVTLQAMPKVKDRKYMTAPLNLWPDPAEKGKPLDVLEKGGKVAVTGVVHQGFAQIVYDDQVRWVSAEYLSDQKPVEPTDSASGDSAASAPGGVSFAPCPDGSATESGLTSGAVRLYRAVCNAFPALTSYGGYDAHGEHSSGKAIDFMINGDSGLGQSIADWARAHASELDLYDVIWAQHIWTPERASEGWRSMPDRGSATANHYDHVHISVN